MDTCNKIKKGHEVGDFINILGVHFIFIFSNFSFPPFFLLYFFEIMILVLFSINHKYKIDICTPSLNDIVS